MSLCVSAAARLIRTTASTNGRQRLQAADREILHGAQRLHAVQRVGRDLELAERIALDAGGAPATRHGETGVGTSKVEMMFMYAVTVPVRDEQVRAQALRVQLERHGSTTRARAAG